MIDENYFDKFLCSEKQSKEMKELLGFNKSCLGGLDKNNNWCWHPDSDIILDIPLKSQFFDWIEETFNINAYVDVDKRLEYYTGGFQVRMFGYYDFCSPIEPLFLVKNQPREKVESELIDFLISWLDEKVNIYYDYKEKNDFFNEIIINKEHLFGVKEKYKKNDIVVWRGQNPAIYRIKSKCRWDSYSVFLSEENDISLSVENLRLATKKEKEILGDLEFVSIRNVLDM
jgi:hypothetical protein